MDVVMPQFGETVTEGTIAAWRFKVGDRVEADDVLLDIESDKVTTEIPAPVAGTIAEILVTEGQTVEVGTVLAVIHPDTAADVEDAAYQAPVEIPSSSGEDISPVSPPDPGAVPLSPAVRRLLAEHGLDASVIQGTGRGRRIKRSDVLEYLESRAQEPEPAAAAAIGDEQGEGATLTPFSQPSRETAEQTVTPEVSGSQGLQAIEVDFTNVARIRTKHGESWREKTGYHLTYLPFIARAVCVAIKDFPNINAGLENGDHIIHSHINLAIAIDPGGSGITMPVIKGSESFTVARFADHIHRLEVKARAGSLSEDDLSGGTYTISNSGTFGTLFTATPVDQSQAAALSAGVIDKRPVVVSGADGDSLAIRSIGTLTQSFNHRAIDWAYSAAFLRRVKSIIEESDWLGKLI